MIVELDSPVGFGRASRPLGRELRAHGDVFPMGRDAGHPATAASVLAHLHVAAIDDEATTLASQTGLRPLVQRLHIGPDAPLARDWWPLRPEGGVVLKLSLDDPNNERKAAEEVCDVIVPSGRGKASSKAGTSKAGALIAALRAASSALDIDVCCPNQDSRGAKMSNDAWHTRVFELQAALKSYVLARGAPPQSSKRKMSGLEQKQDVGGSREAAIEVDSEEGPSGRVRSSKQKKTRRHTPTFRKIKATDDIEMFDENRSVLDARGALRFFSIMTTRPRRHSSQF